MTDQVAGKPANPHEIRHVTFRLRMEVGLINLAGIAVLGASYFFFDPPARQTMGDIPSAWSLLAVTPLYVVGVVAAHRLARPLLDWMREGTPGAPAPVETRRLLLAFPALQAALLMSLWGVAAVGLAASQYVVTSGASVQDLITTLLGVAVSGMVVSTLSFLTAQRLLGPWYPRFFAGADPTAEDVPSTRVRRRLLVAFSLGGVVPMLMIGLAVAQRLQHPSDVGRLAAIVWFLVGVGITAGLMLTLSVRHSIVRPIELIRSAAERVRAGDLTVSVPVESADELGELAVSFNAMVEGLRERRRLEDLFGRQVGPSVMDLVVQEGVNLGGQRRVASVLFLDLVAYTSISEETPPEQVVEMLNEVFDVVVREVDARHGLVNKFIGDAVLAVFGAPVDDPAHARHAVDAAVAIAVRLDRLGIDYGIGVSTGPVVAGNVGAEKRFEYTVVGDAVNEAARLQDLTRERETRILVSGTTVAWLGDGDGMERLGEAQLRGRTRPTELFTPR